MGAKIHTALEFKPSAGGKGITDSGYSLDILAGGQSARPYELLFMALASCLYSTFEDVFRKKRLECREVKIEITGEKRDEVPALLKTCSIRFDVRGADNPSGFEKSFKLACKYCSIFQTLSMVAEMDPAVTFSD